MNDRYLSELDPQWRFIVDELPPLATKVLLRTLYGSAIIGTWYEEGEFIAWMPLPKFSKTQSARLEALLDLGVDITKLSGDTDETAYSTGDTIDSDDRPTRACGNRLYPSGISNA